MSGRVFIVLDNSDEDSTEINIVDAPAWVADDKEAMHWLEGTPIMVVNEYRVLDDCVNEVKKYEDIILDKKKCYRKWMKQSYISLKKNHIKRDRLQKEFIFTCTQSQSYSFKHRIEDYLHWANGFIKLTKLLGKR